MEATAAAVQTYDVSAAQDGSIMAYLVPNNGEDTYAMYIYGAGAMKDYEEASYEGYSASAIAPWWEDYRDALTYVFVDEGITAIGEFAFRLCALEEICLPTTLVEIRKNAFALTPDLHQALVIGENVTTIGAKAFSFSGLTSVTIPASVTTIEKQAFCKCESLESFSVDENNQCFSSTDGILFNKNQTTLICYPAGNARTTYQIPEGVTHISQRAFAGASNLTGTMTIPAACTLGSGVFSYCKNIEKVVWKQNSYNVSGAYVHEDVRHVNQTPESWCLLSAAGTAMNTIWHTNYTKEFYYQVATRILGASYKNQGSYTAFYDEYGVTWEKIDTYAEDFNLNIILEALAAGKIIQVSNYMDAYMTPRDTVGHAYILFGVSEDGMVYVSDPAMPYVTETKYDLAMLLTNAKRYVYALSIPTDLAMKTDELRNSGDLPTRSASLPTSSFSLRGTSISNGTSLTKTSIWTDYSAGKASTELTFSYEAEATDYIYVLDYSDSMTKSTLDEDYTNMSVEKTMAYDSIEAVLTNDPTARVAVVDFHGKNEASCTAFTNDPTDVYNVIANATTQGFTCYADGFEAALAAMNARTGEDANRKTVVVFMSDGDQQWWVNENDHSYMVYLETVPHSTTDNTDYGATEAAALRAAGAEIYAVVLNPDTTEATEAKMAQITGDVSKVHIATTIAEVGEALNDVVEAATLRSFELMDTIGDDFLYDGNLTASEGTTAAIDATNRTITWTLENILPNTEYTLTFDIQCKRNSTGQFVTGDLPTNEGDAEVTEDGETVNTVESPVLHRDPVISTDGAQAHMIHQYADLTRPDNPALYTDGIRFCVTLDMEELQAELEPGDQVAFGIVMLPLNKLQTGETTNYLTMNVGADGKFTTNGSATFVNHTSAISKAKQLTANTMVTWTQAMEDCTTIAAFSNLLKRAGVTIFDVTDDGVRISVYMKFSNAATRQAQADREIAYRGVIVTHNAEDGYVTRYSLQRNNSATRVFNHYNCLNYGVINVDGASEEEMLHGESEYNPAYELQIAAVIE